MSKNRESAVASATTNNCSLAIAWAQNEYSPWGLCRPEADTGLEPLSLRVDQRDQRDRHLANLSGQRSEVIEEGFRVGVEDLIGT